MFAPGHENVVKLLICDSGFSDIKKIADDLVANAKKQGAFIPKLAVELGAGRNGGGGGGEGGRKREIKGEWFGSHFIVK